MVSRRARCERFEDGGIFAGLCCLEAGIRREFEGLGEWQMRSGLDRKRGRSEEGKGVLFATVDN